MPYYETIVNFFTSPVGLNWCLGILQFLIILLPMTAKGKLINRQPINIYGRGVLKFFKRIHWTLFAVFILSVLGVFVIIKKEQLQKERCAISNVTNITNIAQNPTVTYDEPKDKMESKNIPYLDVDKFDVNFLDTSRCTVTFLVYNLSNIPAQIVNNKMNILLTSSKASNKYIQDLAFKSLSLLTVERQGEFYLNKDTPKTSIVSANFENLANRYKLVLNGDECICLFGEYTYISLDNKIKRKYRFCIKLFASDNQSKNLLYRVIYNKNYSYEK